MKVIKFNSSEHLQAALDSVERSMKIAAEKGLDYHSYKTILLEMNQDQNSLARRLLKAGSDGDVEPKEKSKPKSKYNSRYAKDDRYKEMVKYLDESTPTGTTLGTVFTLEKLAENVNSMGYRKFNGTRFQNTDIGSIIGRSDRFKV